MVLVACFVAQWKGELVFLLFATSGRVSLECAMVTRTVSIWCIVWFRRQMAQMLFVACYCGLSMFLMTVHLLICHVNLRTTPTCHKQRSSDILLVACVSTVTPLDSIVCTIPFRYTVNCTCICSGYYTCLTVDDIEPNTTSLIVCVHCKTLDYPTSSVSLGCNINQILVCSSRSWLFQSLLDNLTSVT